MKLRASILLLISSWSVLATGQTAAQESQTPTVPQLFKEERWQEIVRLVEQEPKRSAELYYYYGVALAHLERWHDARSALLAGSRMQPMDRRFPIELGGIAFRQKQYRAATAYLRRAFRLNPSDSYVNEFLATVYFIAGNLEAALKYWNRIGKPQMEELRMEPLPRVDAVLLDRAFAFSPHSNLHLRDWLTTEARLQGLEIFPNYRFDLLGRPDGKFDVAFHAQERNGWGSSKWEGLLGLLRGLPYQQLDPEYFNIRGSAMSVTSLVRWDAQKRRLLVSVSGPWARDPKWHYQLGADVRNENWQVRDSLKHSAPLLVGLNLRREELHATVTRFVGGRLNWSTGSQLSHRDFRTVYPRTALPPQLLAKGYELKHAAQLTYELWRAPEKRFTLTGQISSQTARIWSDPAESFAKLQTSMRFHWFPLAQGDDYETHSDIHAGKTFGQLPFDELFMLGLERDNELSLRGHIGTRQGRKGNAPLGRNYFLYNWNSDKNVYGNGILTLKLGPFVDVGKISDPTSALGSRKWLWDTGIRVKVGVLGLEVVFWYGKDLRSGNNTFYSTVTR